MACESPDSVKPQTEPTPHTVEMPKPTVAPLVLALGVALLAAGLIVGIAFILVGVVILVTGLTLWILHLLPGQGHIHESIGSDQIRSTASLGRTGNVEYLEEGLPGYRLRLPQKVHPISAGVKGGILGGLVMPIPALLYGVLSGHGIWFPVNLLTGIVITGVDRMTVPELEQFHPGLLIAGIAIHIVVSLVMGLMYGVLMPTLPDLPKPLAWGGLLMPLLWTGFSYSLMQFINPLLAERVEWPWFIVSQFIFGVMAALTVMQCNLKNLPWAGIVAGLVGGLIMPIPALLWGFFSGHGIWYPVNLLAGMAQPQMEELNVAALEQFQANWLLMALVIHAAMSLGIGSIYVFLLPKLPVIPGPMSWGGMLLPILWTGTSYGLMGVVNPALQKQVDWPWFIVSQFIFGLVASIAVVRSEKKYISPAGGQA